MSDTTPDNEVQALETGAWCVRVWLITGYNYDKHDVRCGGSPILGPYTWVLESNKEAFIAEMQKRYGQRVRKIETHGRQLCRMDKLPTLEEEIQTFEEYLGKPGVFPPLENAYDY